MDIVIITTIAQIVQRLLAHMRKRPRHSSIMQCQLHSHPFYAKRAANAAIRRTFYDF